jgi:hypothetical protein
MDHSIKLSDYLDKKFTRQSVVCNSKEDNKTLKVVTHITTAGEGIVRFEVHANNWPVYDGINIREAVTEFNKHKPF